MASSPYPFPAERLPDGRWKANGEEIDTALAHLATQAGWGRNGGQWRGPNVNELLPHL